MHDCHLTAVIREVDVVRKHPGHVLVDENDKLVDGALEFVERSLAHVGGIDVQEWGHDDQPYLCALIHERIAREWVCAVPSDSLSAGSFVSPVAARSSSREPLRRNGIGLPWA